MIRHKEDKGRIPKCKPHKWKASRLTTGDPRLAYHWGDVNCPDCLALKGGAKSVDDDTPSEKLEGLAESILRRHRSGDVEDWRDYDDD